MEDVGDVIRILHRGRQKQRQQGQVHRAHGIPVRFALAAATLEVSKRQGGDDSRRQGG